MSHHTLIQAHQAKRAKLISDCASSAREWLWYPSGAYGRCTQSMYLVQTQSRSRPSVRRLDGSKIFPAISHQ